MLLHCLIEIESFLLVFIFSSFQIMTHDPRLEVVGLPPYPPLPASTPTEKVEEIRRTVCVVGLDSTVSAQQCVDAFNGGAGEVKYFRFCTRGTDAVKYALVEFTDHSSVVPALQERCSE